MIKQQESRDRKMAIDKKESQMIKVSVMMPSKNVGA